MTLDYLTFRFRSCRLDITIVKKQFIPFPVSNVGALTDLPEMLKCTYMYMAFVSPNISWEKNSGLPPLGYARHSVTREREGKGWGLSPFIIEGGEKPLVITATRDVITSLHDGTVDDRHVNSTTRTSTERRVQTPTTQRHGGHSAHCAQSRCRRSVGLSIVLGSLQCYF